MTEELFSLALWDEAGDAQRDLVDAALGSSADLGPSAVRDKAVGHVYDKDRSSLPPLGRDLEELGHWSSVTSTVYNKLYQMSRFDPSSSKYREDSLASLRYSFSTCPFWNIEFSFATRNVSVGHSAYQSVVGAIRALCDDTEMTPKVAKAITHNSGQILSRAFEDKEMNEVFGVSQGTTLLQNSTIAVDRGAVRVTLIYGSVILEKRSGSNKYRVLDQDVPIMFGHGTLDFDFCKRHASNILAYDPVMSADWVTLAGSYGYPAVACPPIPEDI